VAPGGSNLLGLAVIVHLKVPGEGSDDTFYVTMWYRGVCLFDWLRYGTGHP